MSSLKFYSFVDLSMSSTKDLTQAIGTSKPNSFVVLASIEDGLPNIHCYIAKELVADKGKNTNGIAAVLENVVSFI